MYRVMIVDDEIWVIRGLLKSIPWNELGFEVIYHTTNSVDALEKMTQLKPELIISDIRMAGMSGIDLLEHVLLWEHRPEFILISAYAEFEYAHKALKCGAFDYLIKPLQKSDLIKSLTGLKTVLDSRQKQLATQLESEILEEYSGFSIRKLFLNNDVATAGEVVCILAYAKHFFSSLSTISFAELLPKQKLVLEDKHFIYAVVSLQIATTAPFEPLCEMFEEQMMFAGTSEFFSVEENIRAYLHQARCSALQFLLQMPDILTIYSRENRLDKKDGIYQTLYDAFSNRNGKIILSIVSDLVELFQRKNHTVLDLLGIGNYICMSLDPYADIFSRMGMDSIHSFLERYQNIEDYLQDLYGIILEVFPDKDHHMLDVVQIQTYIGQHYTEKILISDIANYFHLDINYLSRFFKVKSGQNIKDYLTEKRIEKSKCLLINTKLKIYEISEASGYEDYFYFTRVFRKLTGDTPSQFREKWSDPKGEGI